MPVVQKNQQPPGASIPDSDAISLATALASLDFLVLEKGEQNAVKVCGNAPEWAAVRYGTDIEGGVRESPFLSNFIEEIAAPLWQGPPAAPISSGIWEESGAVSGGAQHFEAIAVHGDNGKLLLVIKRMEERYNELQSLTQRANENALEHRQLSREMQKKDVLLKCIVHDLNNPLGAVLLNLELLSASSDDGVRASASLALESARRQRNLIKSIAEVFSSDLSRLERHGERAEPVSALVRAAEHVVEMHVNAAMRRSVSILLEDGVSNCVPADRKLPGEVDAYVRVIENLVINALRSAPEDSTVTVVLTEMEHSIRVQVNDRGPGVEPPDVASLFDPFTQGTANRGAMGLGLYFCRMTIEQWGGKIEYVPNADGGAQFVFTLPWVNQSAAT